LARSWFHSHEFLEGIVAKLTVITLTNKHYVAEVLRWLFPGSEF
jgi:hypothetical protein